MTRLGLLRVPAILHWIAGVGLGVFCIPAIGNLLGGRDIPIVMGFPAYGQGPFEQVGIRTSAPLLVAFLVVCTLEVVAGVLLWGGYRSGAILALVLLPAAGVFWWGFTLPFGSLLAVMWTPLILLCWPAPR